MRRIVPALASLAALCAVTGAILALSPVAPVLSLGVLYLLAVRTLALRVSPSSSIQVTREARKVEWASRHGRLTTGATAGRNARIGDDPAHGRSPA